MKKIFPFIAVVLFLFAACTKEGDFYGGRYYGKFYNTANKLQADGSLSFTWNSRFSIDTIVELKTIIFIDTIVTADLITHQESFTFDTTYEYIYDTILRINTDINKKDTAFLLNNLIELNIDKDKKEKECYYDSLCDHNLVNFLKTIPAIDELQICDSTDFIKTMDIKATFHGNSVESFLKCTTSHGDTVTVKFLGSY